MDLLHRLYSQQSFRYVETDMAITYMPFTPAGTPLDHLAADTETEAWENLLEDAKHMPYRTQENFQKRGYSVLPWEEE
jgi:hypothetical protein